uniref:Uncharacterized protein n=1 Tax=Mola mola TaxID=94237 RepID=A0A3Q4AH72_MOLML
MPDLCLISSTCDHWTLLQHVRDRPRSGHPKKTTPQEGPFLTLSALRKSSTDLQSVGRKIWAARRPALTAVHRQIRYLSSHFVFLLTQVNTDKRIHVE